MKIAGLWTDVVDGVPVLDPSLTQDDATDADRIIEFLNGGTSVLRAAGYSKDWLDVGRAEVVPIGFRTDGTWVWPDEMAYYLETHRVVPPGEFVTYIRDSDYRPGSPTSDELQAARELLEIA